MFHDDQHGTAIVTLAALINACRLTGSAMEDLEVTMVGAGAAGVAVVKILMDAGVRRSSPAIASARSTAAATTTRPAR